MDNDIKIGENHIYILYIMLVKKENVIMYKERQVIALFTKKRGVSRYTMDHSGKYSFIHWSCVVYTS